MATNTTVASVQSDALSLMPCSRISQELIEKNGWQGLVESGKFNEEKALLSLQISESGYLKNLKPSTIEEAVATPAAAFSTLKLYRGEVTLNALIHKLIYQIRDFFSVGRQLTDTQVEFLCDLIFEEYYWMTIAEFKLFQRKCMKAEFGQVFDRLDGDTIMQWLKKFSGEVLEVRQRIIREQEQEQRKQAESGEKKPLPTEFVDRMTALFARWEEREKTRKVKRHFVSLEQYTHVAGLDKNQFFENLERKIKNLFEATQTQFPDLDYEQFRQWQQSNLLIDINKKWLEGVEVAIIKEDLISK